MTHRTDTSCPDVAFAHAFYFLRHGETLFNRERRFQGQLDVALSDLGLAQAEAAAAVLAGVPVARIVSSPLIRARRTADMVAARGGLAVEDDPGLKECHLGVHQGQPYAPWLADYWTGNFAPEGGEDFWQFRRRAVPAMARIAAGGPGALIVGHGGLWFALRSLYRTEPEMARMPNALPLEVVPGPGAWRVRVLEAPGHA